MSSDDVELFDDRDPRVEGDGFDEDLEAFDEDDLEDFDDDDDDDFIEDATAEEIDLVVAAYREDGEGVVVSMNPDLANDLDELITQLRRLPGDAGAVGAVSIASEFFVAVRVRGRNVEVLLSDAMSANDWPIAHDVAEFLGIDPPDPDEDDDDDDSEWMGDIEMFADLGIGEMDMEAIVEEAQDNDSEDAVGMIFEQLKFGPQYRRALASGGTR